MTKHINLYKNYSLNQSEFLPKCPMHFLIWEKFQAKLLIKLAVFVHGTGKRKAPFQKSIETLEGYLGRLKEYNQKIHICGERNSYSKTDHNATFMRMKEIPWGMGS